MANYTLEHEFDGIHPYNDRLFEKAKSELLEIILILNKLNITPRIGEKIFPNLDGNGIAYYIKDIIYYKDGITFYLNEIK
jgi:hypothetical protein